VSSIIISDSERRVKRDPQEIKSLFFFFTSSRKITAGADFPQAHLTDNLNVFVLRVDARKASNGFFSSFSQKTHLAN